MDDFKKLVEAMRLLRKWQRDLDIKKIRIRNRNRKHLKLVSVEG